MKKFKEKKIRRIMRARHIFYTVKILLSEKLFHVLSVFARYKNDT